MLFDMMIRDTAFLAIPYVTFCLVGIVTFSVNRRRAPLPAKLGIVALSILLGGELFFHIFLWASAYGLSWGQFKYLHPTVEYIRLLCIAILVYAVMLQRDKQS